MKAKWERLAPVLLIATGFAPLPILLAWGNDLPLAQLWPLAYLLAAGVSVLLPGKSRLMVAGILAAGMLALGFAALPQGLMLVLALAYTVLLFVVLPGREAVTQTAVFGGIAIHALAQAFLNLMDEALRAETYAPAAAPLTISLLIFLAAALLTMNGFSLESAMPEGKGVPKTIRSRNRALTWLMLAAALLISLIPALGKLLETLWAWLRQAVSMVIRWLLSLQGPQAASGQNGAADVDMSGLGEATPPSAFAMWLEKIMLAVTAVAAAVLFLWAMWKLWKKLLVLVRWLLKRLQSYASSATEDYVDEVQDTRTQGEERFSLTRLRKKRPSAKEVAALPPRERIRARYALLRGKHPEWPSSLTARETLSNDAARIYERARYSAHEVTEQDADAFLK